MANRRGEFVPGELIVKFKDSSSVRMRAPRAVDFRSTTVDAVDQTFRALGVQQVEELMPLTGGAPMRQNVRSFSGSPVPSAPMALAYRVTLSPDANIFDAINQLQALDQVEYAEPNYLVYTLEDKDPDDPYYTNQYGIQDVNLYNLWGMPVLSKEGPVIAILDTGVDITHPDLIDNIWTNTSESDGAYKFDDDGNGFVDDVHGWDFINQTGDIFDYNGHGTHCAGIAAATGYNGKGIIGANPDARIMPVTVMQSNGTGNIATIIKGIDYAAANGAAIISMSLGTYSTSTAFEQALGRAYQKCVLVAAAGNDGYCLNHAHPEKGQLAPAPQFPAAYNFVLGVQASKPEGGLAGFSNYDDNGPVFSSYTEQYNYELTVPGASIVSTFPNGQYKYLNGTSMATPLAAGAISRLLQAKEYTNKEVLFSDLIHCLTSKGNTDFYAAYQISDEQRKPELQVSTFAIEDPEGDNDGRPDAGELINIYPTIRNAWGTAKNIRIKLECAETINNVYTPVVDEVDFGWELSAYGSARSANPLQIRLKDDVTDGRIIMLKLIVTGDNAATVELPIQITAENGVELGGVISEDMTLYPDVHYIVTTNLAVPEGVTLTILPGTVLKFRENTGLNVQGNIIANGEPGNMITFMPADGASGYMNGFNLGHSAYPTNKLGFISYATFTNLRSSMMIRYANLSNCILKDNNTDYGLYISNVDKCAIYQNDIVLMLYSNLFNTNYCENRHDGINHTCFDTFENTNSFNNDCKNYGLFSVDYWNNSEVKVFTPEQPNYLGSAREDIVKPLVLDIRTGFGFGQYDLSNMRTRPVAQAHGIVWKVVVDGYDAQDEYESLPPLGVGRHEFKVYFNRPMNHDKAPVIAMGLREPYTQTAIAEDGAWSSEVFDGETVDIYTAYLTLRGKDNIDGVNTIYVAQAEDDEFFEIPVEKRRFHVNVQSAGSLSAGFMAEAGVGKVSLSWDNTEENFDDMLGYNLYRYTLAEDGSQSEPACINRSLITPDETEFVDYDITPGNTYCYYYKVLSTSLTENSPSKVVAATPRAASKGDANGSGDVDVNDVVSIVNYMVGVDQRPFILDAADVNSDTAIDILDVVSTVNIILTPEQAAKPAAAPSSDGMAIYYVEDGVLYVDSPVALSGVDITFAATPRVSSFTPMADIAAMEVTGGYVTDGLYRVVIFSAAGKAIPAGRTALLRIADADIEAITLADTRANRVEAQAADESGVSEAVADEVLRPWPNPFKDFINVPVTVAADQDGKVTVTLVNLAGQIVAMQSLTLQPGAHTVTLATDALPQGFYLLSVSVDSVTVLADKVIKR